MLAGIMAIFEMGLALTGRSLLPAPQDRYLSNIAEAKDRDKHLLALLDEKVVSGLDAERLCEALQAEYVKFPIASATPVKSGRWLGSCVLSEYPYRAIVYSPVSPVSLDPPLSYQVYSCVVKDDSAGCSFEQEGD